MIQGDHFELASVTEKQLKFQKQLAWTICLGDL